MEDARRFSVASCPNVRIQKIRTKKNNKENIFFYCKHNVVTGNWFLFFAHTFRLKTKFFMILCQKCRTDEKKIVRQM